MVEAYGIAGVIEMAALLTLRLWRVRVEKSSWSYFWIGAGCQVKKKSWKIYKFALKELLLGDCCGGLIRIYPGGIYNLHDFTTFSDV